VRSPQEREAPAKSRVGVGTHKLAPIPYRNESQQLENVASNMRHITNAARENARAFDIPIQKSGPLICLS
jgi:hypothetical protein